MVITTEAEWKTWVEDMTGGHNGVLVNDQILLAMMFVMIVLLLLIVYVI